MVKSKLIGPNEATFLEDEPKFWYRDEHGKATRVEIEYLLPINHILIEETYSEQDRYGNQIDQQTSVNLPYFPGDIYFNHKAVPSRRPGNKGELTFQMSAGRNGATLEWLGSEKISEYAREQSLEFNYEGTKYLVKYVAHGSYTPFTKEGKRGSGGARLRVRLFDKALADTEMIKLGEISPDNPEDLRLMSCLATLLSAFNIYKVGERLENGQTLIKLSSGLDNVTIHLVRVKGDSWDYGLGPF